MQFLTAVRAGELLAPLQWAIENPQYRPSLPFTATAHLALLPCPLPSQLPQVVELLAPLLSVVDSQPVLLKPLASRGEAGAGY